MILKNATIVLENKIIENGWIETKQDKIVSINKGTTDKEGIDLKNCVIMPGFIDCHVHGGYGTSIEDATIDSLSTFAKKVTAEGVTRYCQSTVTVPTDLMDKILSIYSRWMKEENHRENKARQIGLHIEGPFLSEGRKGAHSTKLLKNPDIKLMEKWMKESGNNIKIVTYAIERDTSAAFTKFLVKHNIIPSIGHSDCTAEQFEKIGKANGAKHVTHLYNAMSKVSHYTEGNGKPAGLAAAALANEDVLCEIISDGIHVNDTALKLAYKAKGQNGLCLITDSMSAKGLPDGKYKLGPMNVFKKGMSVKLIGENSIAGSAATFDHCFRHFKNLTKADYITMAKISSENIAKQLRIFDKLGSIAVGKIADFVVLNKTDNVQMTIVDGEIAFKNKK